MTTFFVGRPVEICTPSRPTVTEDDKLRLLDYPTHTFDEETFKRLRAVAREAGVTLNDLLLRDVILGIRTWNRKHDPRTWGRTIRIIIPVDLRTTGDELMPAADIVAMVFLDRRPRIFPNARWLLKSVNLEMRFIKAGRFGIAFVRACGLLGLFPGGLRRLTRAKKRCYATAVLSNMGRPFVDSDLARRGDKVIAGDLTLESVESAPPVRPHTAAAFTCLSYAGRFVLIMCYDRYHFTPEGAGDFLDTVVGEIRESAGRSTDAVPHADAAVS